MSLPLVMPSNCTKMALRLEEKYPGRLGVLFSPDGKRDPKGLPYALDNGRYAVWSKGKAWDEVLFTQMLEYAAALSYPPLWLVVPDVVADRRATLDSWQQWYPRLSIYQWPLALAVQDGMTVKEILKLRPSPDVIFVGGTMQWKWRYLQDWTRAFPRVHVGRVNERRMLWMVQRAGAESSDGTGWFYHRQQRGLVDYLEKSTAGQAEKARGFWY